jgi:hypothetical protein
MTGDRHFEVSKIFGTLQNCTQGTLRIRIQQGSPRFEIKQEFFWQGGPRRHHGAKIALELVV